MKRFLKITGIITLILLSILYICFLFVVPRVVDVSKYKSDLQKIVKEQANINLDYKNEKLITTPLLGIGFKADDLKLTLPDNSEILKADSLKATVSLPHILLLTVRVSSAEFENPTINAEILPNGEDYKIVKHIENLLNTKKETTFAQKPVEEAKEGFQFDPNWIKIVVPNVRLNNYKVLVKELSTGNYLDLHGEKLIFGYYNGKNIRVRTSAELFSNKNKNVSAKVDFDTFLPPPSPKLDEEDDPAEKIDIPFINPVKTYQNYDLKADIDTKIKIRNSITDGLTSWGYLNVENLTLKLSKIQLPASYLKLKTFGKLANIDTDLYATPNEHLHLFGKLNYSNHPNMDLNIKTGKIEFQNLLNLAEAFLQSLQIKNELYQYKADGTLLSDCHIKTNFKSLKSEGFIKIQNGALKVRNLGEVLSKVNINILLDNNILKIENSGLLVENSEVKIKGKIDEKSYTDVNITMADIPLSKLYNAFAPKDLRTSYNLKSGNIKLSFNLQGKMKEAISKAQISLRNLNFGDRNRSFDIQNKELSVNEGYEAKNKILTGDIENNDFKFLFPKTSSVISLPELQIKIADKNINIAQNNLIFNKSSEIKYSGQITNYEKLENITFLADGNADTSDIIKFIGNDLKPYFNLKGKIPVKLTLNGNKDKQTLFVQALGSPSNYITPIDFTSLWNKNTSLQATVDFKPNRIKIKNTGLYTRTVTQNEEGQDIVSLDKIMELDGTVERNRINLMKFDIPVDLEGKIFLFPKSSFVLEHTKLYAFGKASIPLIRGDLNLRMLTIPEIRTTLNNLGVKIGGRELFFLVKDFRMRNSDINIEGKYSLNPADNIVLRGLNITSRYINLDDVTNTTEALNKYIPSGNTGSSPSGSQQNIPVIIPDGKIRLNKIVTGNIELTNTVSQLLLRRNILYLNNLSTNVFKGIVNGNIDVDLIKLLIGVDVKGSNINIEKALLDSSGMKDALTGTTDFTAKLKIDGNASTQEEQMKGIDGDITFKAKDGQFGPFGKLENMILAENIRESQFFQTALGGVINKLSTIDTTHYTELEGHLLLKDGICNIDYISSKGNVMNLHILGNFDILKNYADMKVRVKITSILSNLLGPLNAINPVNLMNSAASMNVVTAKAFSLFCETVPEEEFAILPTFDNKYVDSSATKFQLGVRGDAAKPLTLIKSFKWLATQAQYDSAENFVESIPEQIEGSTATTVSEVIAEAKAVEEAKEAEKKTLKYKVKHIFKREKSE